MICKLPRLASTGRLRQRRGALAFGILALIGGVLALASSSQAQPQTIRVGILKDYQPYYQQQRETGDPSGFAIDAMTWIAARAGLRAQYTRFDSVTQLLAAVRDNRIDVVPVLPNTAETRQEVTFVGRLHQSKLSLFTRTDNADVRRTTDLLGRRVSFIREGAAHAFMREFRGELSIPYMTADDVVSAVVAGTSDAAIIQEEVGANHARSLGVSSLLLSSSAPVGQVNLEFAVRSASLELINTLNRATQEYVQSERYRQSRQTWLSTPEPPFDLRRLLLGIGALFLVTIVGFALWRYASVMRLNAALDHAVKETQEAESRFRDYAEAAADWFFETDAQHRFTFLSPRYVQITGLSSDSVIGVTPAEAHAGQRVPGDDAAWKDLDTRLAREEDWQDIAFDLVTRDGERKTITMSGRAIHDDANVFTGYRGVGRDITQRVATERALRQAQKMESVGQLTGGIAHDFNNLLTVLIGNMELLRKRLKGDELATGYLETACSAATLGSDLTKRLLAFSRQQTLDPKPIVLDESVANFIPLIEHALGGGIEIVSCLRSLEGMTCVDESQFQNALLNLAINARDAMPNGGTLKISTTVIESTVPGSESQVPVEGDVERVGKCLRVTVTDTGVGIAPEHLETVVEPFFTTKDAGKGTGLGLSMAYGFATQSGGGLEIESRKGVGTSVHLDLPLLEGDVVVPDPVGAPTCGTETLLVVDDEPEVREITARRLESLGYAVLEASDGATALRELEMNSATAKIDLLLTDVIMPKGLSGIELAAEARKLVPGLKVVFASGHTNEVVDDRDRENWLQKPYSLLALADKVREVLDR